MKRILIVDDSVTARIFVRRCLEAIGFSQAEFVEAENGRIALDKAKENPVDLVVSDLTMPEMDGESLLKRLKSNPTLHEVPVLIISSAGNPAKVTELLEMGALAVLAKPFSPADIYGVLQPFIPTEE